MLESGCARRAASHWDAADLRRRRPSVTGINSVAQCEEATWVGVPTAKQGSSNRHSVAAAAVCAEVNGRWFGLTAGRHGKRPLILKRGN